jgi:hypothetical protein
VRCPLDADPRDHLTDAQRAMLGPEVAVMILPDNGRYPEPGRSGPPEDDDPDA